MIKQACVQMAERTGLRGKSIILADRGYGGMNLIEHLNRIPGCEYLIRIKDGLWKETRDLPMVPFDIDITMNIRTTQTNTDKAAYASGEAKWIPGHGRHVSLKTKHWDFESPYTLTFRIVRFEIAPGKYETAATSLPRNGFSPKELKWLYHLRWGVETSFCQLKYAVGVTNFHARKTESVIQEIYARIIMFNFCMRIAVHVSMYQDKNRKWTYQVNYSMGVYICQDFFRQKTGPPIDPEIEISRYILPVRPNRADRRKIKSKPAVCFLYRVA